MLIFFTETRPVTFDLLSPMLHDEFYQKCRSVYQHGPESSPMDKLLVYSCLSNTCGEFSGTNDGNLSTYYHGLSSGFYHLLFQALATFPMLAPASMDTVEALLAAVSSDILHKITKTDSISI